jgi:integrase/recombinase XerD
MDNAVVVRSESSVVTRGADSDAQLVKLWLHGRSEHTQRAYSKDAERFRSWVGKLLDHVTLDDLQRFADSLDGSVATRSRVLSSVKSLFAFGHKLGYLPFDTARVLKLPKRPDALAERILSEPQVVKLVAGMENAREDAVSGDDTTAQDKRLARRDEVLVKLLYVAGLRVSEVCGLTWRNCVERGDAGQVTVFGKGGKTRVVLLPSSLWSEVVSLRGTGDDAAHDDAPVFLSRKGGALDPSQVRRIVYGAAKGARLRSKVSPHWLRHAHASHAIDKGAPVSLVQATLGHASLATTGRYLHARPNDSSARYLGV